jgi:flavin-dependent dehydrogenase
LTEPEGVRDALASAPHTRARLIGREAPARPQVSSACSRVLAELAGPGWAAAGDAAASFDPLSSMGIGHALWSGTHAARLAEDVLLGPSSFGTTYSNGMQQQYEQYLQLRERYYRLEQRWPDRPFWRCRHGCWPSPGTAGI